MGLRNFLIEGVSGTGKTSVFNELRRRGHHAINGDTELAYQGDPETGVRVDGFTHEHHLWRVADVKALVADRSMPATFFCGGSRNFPDFLELFDAVFVLEVDSDTLNRRLSERGIDEWGGRPTERQLIQRLHQTGEDLPSNGITIDATAPIAHVVDEILRRSDAAGAQGGSWPTEFRERFARLDPSVWTDGYLPAWSSRDAAAASYSVGSHGLVLSIPEGQQLWCPSDHPTPLRVSGIHSANRSGPVGSHDAQQPFRAGQVVREHQPTLRGFVPHFGTIAVTCTARLTPRSMFSAWMVGLEDRPDRCGEICLMEVFGNTLAGGTADVGQGIHNFRDPALHEDFAAQTRVIDVAEQHTYRADWRPGRVTFSIDDATTRVCDQAPDYPMMLILGLFDFPGEPGEPGGGVVPEFAVTDVVGTDLGEGSVVRGR